MPPKHSKPMKPLPTTTPATDASQASQGQLDELTNKIFNEMLQNKAEAAATQKPKDLCSMKSNDAPSESSSSLFDRMRRQQRDNGNIPGSKLPKLKKKSTSSQHSEEVNAVASITPTPGIDPKKPIIAKLKAGVKLQSTERVAETQGKFFRYNLCSVLFVLIEIWYLQMIYSRA